jgi:hypothetical protein
MKAVKNVTIAKNTFIVLRHCPAARSPQPAARSRSLRFT